MIRINVTKDGVVDVLDRATGKRLPVNMLRRTKSSGNWRGKGGTPYTTLADRVAIVNEAKAFADGVREGVALALYLIGRVDDNQPTCEFETDPGGFYSRRDEESNRHASKDTPPQ